ncbi:MAG: family 43 glycosylhydrolase [Bacteroidales bacterium]|nr:family 43 glycosylhydrolase [Bacteroidales bacterium]
MKKLTGTVIGLLLVAGLGAQTVDNPVIRDIADCGVLRWAGHYYIGGVSTYGDFLVSDELVHWDGKVHAFDLDNQWTHGTGAKNNQVHANDMTYIGNKFHLLFSVNYWGSDRHIVHITHAVADTPGGPYKEGRDDHWFENRIDPMAFQDEDGKVFLYMVKFTDGNVIWGRPMNERFEFTGDAREMFTSRPHSWERMDNKVIEGPFVVKHHGSYYMMYNVNHTALSYGNYRLGVAQADSPLGFNEGNKYPWPVVEPNEYFVTPGQPNIVRGPNGFEWWLVYMANPADGGNRSQFIDRIHFVDGRLTVDAVHGKDSPGYHPVPAKPVLEGQGMVSLPDAGAYLLEVTMTDPSTESGIRVWENGKSWIDVGIDNLSGKGFIRSKTGRKAVREEVSLPYLLEPGRPHLWRVENNHGTISAWVDGILLCDHRSFGSFPDGHPSLLNKDVETEYVTYSLGWDEWGSNISGWGNTLPSGKGLTLPAGDVFKGVPRNNYEFSALLRNGSPESGRFGVYASWTDPMNYCLMTVDPKKRGILVEDRRNGRSNFEEFQIRKQKDIYPDPKYSDAWEKQYRFPEGEVCLDAVELPMADFESEDGGTNPDPSSLFKASYLSGGRWVPLDYSVENSSRKDWQRLCFKEIRTEALSFINSDPNDPKRHISGIKADVTLQDAYQFRVLRENGKLYLYVDNVLVYTGTAPSGPSRIGLFSDGASEVRLEDSLYYVK